MKRKALALGICATLAVTLTGCARKPSNAKVDPYENFNRVVFAFNQDVDHLIYRPVAKVYKTIVPPPIRVGVSNAFDNIEEVTTMSNDLLQGKIKYVFLDFWRFVINSTIGVAGLFDVASHMGLKRHYNDFGMTLAYWSGKETSPYLQIPFLGPTTFRDGFGEAFDYVMSPYPYVRPTGWNIYSNTLNLAQVREQLLPTDPLVDNAFDQYIFVRNAYLQHRNATVAANMTNGLGHTEPPRFYRRKDTATLPEPKPKA